ncbi:hypothetical protein [Legionella tucsonensis]|uniref:Fir n=1 Tax=Legionella tucsonensis TaxID=40335 RepID=D6BJP2_9GAMM|nr:hypothetical protein [Legionella tucsonensis]ACF77015.1 Fir [Legionella tucsonensis]KTD74490.1 hypothetical protein Ltuc_2337 [Legionella tucsonensis]
MTTTFFKKEEDERHIKAIADTMSRMEKALENTGGKGLDDVKNGSNYVGVIDVVVDAPPKDAKQVFEAEKQKLEAMKEQKAAPDHSSIKQSIQGTRQQNQMEDIELDASESNSFEI